MSVAAFSLPLREPLTTAAGDIERRDGFLVREAGGLGEATPLPGWTESLDACREALDASLDGGPDPSVHDAPAARHALSLARADGAARERGVSLAAELGGANGIERTSVPVNATIGDGTPAETAAAATEALDAGFRCLKVKVGARPLAEERERLRALRDVVPDAALRLDANGAYDHESVREALDCFAAFDPAYVEQPVPPGHLDALRDAPVPIAADESLAERTPEALIEAGVDVLVLKPMALGGPRRVTDIAALARNRGIDCVVTTTVDGVVARLGALHAAATFEGPPCGLATGDLLARDLGPDPAPVRAGAMALPDAPGLGIAPEEVCVDA